jgi:hypothetical protein
VKNRKLVSAAVGLSLLAGLAACTGVKPDPDNIILYYSAGAGDDKKFMKCVPGGTTGDWAADNNVYELPRSLRTWNIREDKTGDSDIPIKSASNIPGAEVTFYTSADFYLNTFCGANNNDPNSPIVQFWEQTGRRKWNGKSIADDGEGKFNEDAWKNMLTNTLVTAQEKVLRTESRKYDPYDLDGNLNGVWQKIEQVLGAEFQKEMNAKVGGDYFCGAGYKNGTEVEWTEWVSDGLDDKGNPKFKEVSGKKGTCPPIRISINNVNLANAEFAAARTQVLIKEQQAKAALIEAQSKVDVAKKLAEADQATLLALEQLKVDLMLAEACAKNPNCSNDRQAI